MRKLLAIVSLLVVFSAAPALAVTDGELDGDRHPAVGLMVAQDEEGLPLWRCSGTLVSSRVFLTAGHCTEPPAVRAQIWFDDDVESGRPSNGYPEDPEDIPVGERGGKAYTHPLYDADAFWRYDAGIVVLDRPYRLRPGQYGQLPMLNELDAYKTRRGKNKLWFTAVGYGLQQSFPTAAAWKNRSDRVRMVAYPKLNQINGGIAGRDSLLLSNNTRTGGTCFGDSGGPNFIKGSMVIGGVTSFGLNGNCAGTGGVYRVDRSDDLRWINSFLR